MAKGFTGNTHPKRFGSGNEEPRKDWLCVCQNVNKRYMVNCPLCGISRELAAEYHGEVPEWILNVEKN